MRLPRNLRTVAGQKLMALLGLALLYGGVVVLLLAGGVAPADVQRYSGYQTVYDQLAKLESGHWSDLACGLIGVGGGLLLVLLLTLGWAQRLIPARTRAGEVVLTRDALGLVTVSPRAVERAAEIAACQEPGVDQARARFGNGELFLALGASEAGGLPELLRGAQHRAREALVTSGLVAPDSLRVSVTRFGPSDPRAPMMITPQPTTLFPAVLGFAFVAVAFAQSFGVAVLCLLGAGVFHLGARLLRGDVSFAELRERADAARTGFSSPPTRTRVQ